MEHNIKLIKYFIAEYHKSENSMLHFLVSPTFKFSVDGGAEMNFQEYSDRKDVLKEYVEFEFGSPETEDDVCFTVELKLIVKQDGAPNVYGTGVFEILVVKNLIERVEVLYDAATREKVNFHTAIRNLVEAIDDEKPQDGAEPQDSAKPETNVLQ